MNQRRTKAEYLSLGGLDLFCRVRDCRSESLQVSVGGVVYLAVQTVDAIV